MLTALLVPWIIRRSMGPLRSLAMDASTISALSWRFVPAAEVRQVAELRPLVEALKGVIGRPERSFIQQRQFTGDAAHELKTAVAVVKSSIQLLELRARTAEEYEAGLKRCYADCLRVEELAQQMLLLARVEEAPSEEQQTSLTEGIEAARAVLAPLAALREVCLEVFGTTAPSVGLELEALRSLLVDLLTNALQHSPAASLVRINCQCKDGWMRLQVEDCGDGIAAKAAPFVFDRFYRGRRLALSQDWGHRPGLAICKAIVERVGGTISLESMEGRGTTVTIYANPPSTPRVNPLLRNRSRHPPECCHSGLLLFWPPFYGVLFLWSSFTKRICVEKLF